MSDFFAFADYGKRRKISRNFFPNVFVMKNYLLFVLAIASIMRQSICFAQNLVPNPSFEDTIECPYFTGDIAKCKDWFSFGGSPDYFDVCASKNGFAAAGVPKNAWGYQIPFDGNAYVGVGTWSNIIPVYREYIGTQLVQLLMPGLKYFVSAFISRADSLMEGGATNNFGFRFSTISYSETNSVPTDNFSEIHSDSIIRDRVNWSKIAGSFIADSAYRYLIIGNFYDNNRTDTFDCPLEAFYYIDAVCVATDSLACASWVSVSNIFNNYKNLKIYPDPANNLVHVDNVIGKYFYSIINCVGQKILEGNLEQKENQIDVSMIPSGIYVIDLGEKLFTKFLIIH